MEIDASFIGRNAAALSETRDLHALLDTVPDAMVVIDTTGRILSFSRGAERMFGYAESDVIGENVSILMPSPDRERHNSYLSRYLQTGEKQVIGKGRVATARRRDGETFPINLSVGEMELGGVKVFAGVVRDLTDIEETEKKLRNLQAELAHVSRIISMGALATSIAHELNQPLTAVTNYVQAVRDMLESPSAEDMASIREALHECGLQALRAGDILHRLRDFVSAGETTRQIANLEQLVREATALALLDADIRNLDVQTLLETEGAQILADPIQIQQVLVNLLRNALEAMEKSRIKKLVISSRNDANGMLRVSVADSGSGLDPRIAEQLFNPFISSKSDGMGLGLSICRTIVTAHGGKIWGEPSEFGGTAFHFTVMSADADGDHG